GHGRHPQNLVRPPLGDDAGPAHPVPRRPFHPVVAAQDVGGVVDGEPAMPRQAGPEGGVAARDAMVLSGARTRCTTYTPSNRSREGAANHDDSATQSQSPWRRAENAASGPPRTP